MLLEGELLFFEDVMSQPAPVVSDEISFFLDFYLCYLSAEIFFYGTLFTKNDKMKLRAV